MAVAIRWSFLVGMEEGKGPEGCGASGWVRQMARGGVGHKAARKGDSCNGT